MPTPFPLHFEDDRTARPCTWRSPTSCRPPLPRSGCIRPERSWWSSGGLEGWKDADLDRLGPLFESGLLPVITRLGAVAIDGGTWSGVMRLLGEARSDAGAGFPLVGVAAVGTVTLPGGQPPQDDAAPLDPDHSHFVLVPGDDWGAESSWIARVATALAGDSALGHGARQRRRDRVRGRRAQPGRRPTGARRRGLGPDRRRAGGRAPG